MGNWSLKLRNEYDMALSNEDMFMFILAGILFLLSFVDIRSPSSLAWISFLVSGLVFISWGFVRFRRRPLTKQVHYTKNIHLVLIKILRYQSIFTIIIFDLLILLQYIPLNNAELQLPIVYNYIVLFVMTILELVGNVTVSDATEFFPKLKGESEEDLKQKRFQILFGNRFWIWITITSIISLGLLYFPYASVILSGDILLILMQFLGLLLGIGFYLFWFKRVMEFENLDSADMVAKAADYYNTIDFKERSFNLLEGYLEKSENIAIMSKLALMYVPEKKYDKALILTDKILKETEEKNVNVPHMISKAYLVRALCFKEKEQFEKAYKEVNKSLKYTPENNVARKLRRDLRKTIKTQKFEEEK